MKERIISIDIGRKNLGYTIAECDHFDSNRKIEEVKFHFGLFNIDGTSRSKDNIVIHRTRTLQKWITENCISEDSTIIGVVIERQVANNTIAMSVMYLLCGLFSSLTSNICIFAPALKFDRIKQPYESQSKKHKALSVSNATHISTHLSNESCESLISELSIRTKRDDIADSFNQLVIWLIDERLLSNTFEDIQSWIGLI